MSKEAEDWSEKNICKKLCDVCIMSNGSKCTSYNFAMKGFDAGVASINKRIGDVNDYYDQLNGMSEDYQAGYLQAEKDMPKQFEAVHDIIQLQKELDALKERNKWHTGNPTKDGLYLCKIEKIGPLITYRVCEWRNRPLGKYDRNWQGQGYSVLEWKEIE